MAPIYETLCKAGADIVLAAHDHDYERFAPLDPSGNVEPSQPTEPEPRTQPWLPSSCGAGSDSGRGAARTRLPDSSVR